MANRTPGLEVDLRVGDLGFRGGLDVIRAVFVYGAPLAAVAMIAFLVLSAVQYQRLSSRQAEIEQRYKDAVVGALPGVEPSVVRDGNTAKALMTESLDLARKRAMALDRSGLAPPTVDVLHALTLAFPPHPEVTVDVSELTITPESVSFTAETDGYASAAAVEEALQASPRFSQATKGNERKSRDKVSFTMSVPLVANSTEAEPSPEDG
jgi:hypothetical protein